jgi:hypothetical protein
MCSARTLPGAPLKDVDAVAFFVLASAPWWLFRLRPLRDWQRVAAALAARVNTAGILLQLSRGGTGLALEDRKRS